MDNKVTLYWPCEFSFTTKQIKISMSQRWVLLFKLFWPLAPLYVWNCEVNASMDQDSYLISYHNLDPCTSLRLTIYLHDWCISHMNPYLIHYSTKLQQGTMLSISNKSMACFACMNGHSRIKEQYFFHCVWRIFRKPWAGRKRCFSFLPYLDTPWDKSIILLFIYHIINFRLFSWVYL